MNGWTGRRARERALGLARRVVVAAPPLVLAAAVLAVWEAWVAAAAVPPSILPAPSRITTAGLNAAGTLAWHAARTLAETLAGLLMAVLVGTVCAAAMERSAWLRRALLPLLVVSQTIPIVAVAPLLVLWFGFDILPKILVVALVCFFPIVVATAQGLASVDAEVVRLYRTFGASAGTVFRLVRVPTAIPYFFTGLRVAVTYSVIGAIFGEYVGAERGLGIFLQNAKNAHRTDLVFATIGVTAALSLALYGVTLLVERRVAWWVRTDA